MTFVARVAALRRLQRTVRRIARTHYAPFLFGRNVPEDEIPVFIYHEVSAADFDGDLAFLSRNGYRTLSLDEYCERMRASRPGREKCVLLTFDDARRNFWDIAFPILQRWQARAALFVPTYWSEELHASAATPPGFMTWQQLVDCAASGLVDVESHAHRHTLVFTSPRLAGFATPASLADCDLFDWPMRRESGIDVCGRPPLGSPVYESTPLLSATRRYLEPEQPTLACRGLVESEGGARFFAKRGALAKLEATFAAAALRVRGEFVSPSEYRKELEAELKLAVESFHDGLGRKPRYFAYPWMLGGAESLALLTDFGFEVAFGVGLDFGRARRESPPIRVYARYKSDWLRFLPGNGRRTLAEVVPRKIATFLRSQHFAH